MHRAAAAVALVALAGLAACSGDGGPTPTSLPPTTATPTPFAPTGTADVVRRWVGRLASSDVADAFGLLTAEAQERADGLDGFRNATGERREWARWSDAVAPAYDAVPIADDLAMVVLRGRFGDAEEQQVLDATAVPVRPAGDDWRVDAFGDVGEFQADPAPGTEVDPEPTLAALVDVGVDAVVFVDGQPAEDVRRTPAGEGRERVEFRPNRPLRPGPHVVAVLLLDADGEAAARATVYVVPE